MAWYGMAYVMAPNWKVAHEKKKGSKARRDTYMSCTAETEHKVVFVYERDTKRLTDWNMCNERYIYNWVSRGLGNGIGSFFGEEIPIGVCFGEKLVRCVPLSMYKSV